MAGQMEMRAKSGSAWRIAMWGGAAGVLTIPAIAMQLTSEVAWDPEDFITMGVMLALACGAFELAVRVTQSSTKRGLAGIAIVGIFLLVWVELAADIFH